MDLVTSVALALLILVLSRAALGIAHAHKFYPEQIIVRLYKRVRRRFVKVVRKRRELEGPPVIENAPGITWKRLKAGWLAEWHAPKEVAQHGYRPAKVRLWCGEKDELTRKPVIEEYIRDWCHRMQQEMCNYKPPSIEEILQKIKQPDRVN